LPQQKTYHLRKKTRIQKQCNTRGETKRETVEQPLFSELGLIDYINSDENLLGEPIQIPEMDENITVDTASFLLSLYMI